MGQYVYLLFNETSLGHFLFRDLFDETKLYPIKKL